MTSDSAIPCPVCKGKRVLQTSTGEQPCYDCEGSGVDHATDCFACLRPLWKCVCHGGDHG